MYLTRVVRIQSQVDVKMKSSSKDVVDPFQAIIGDFGKWQLVISLLFIYNSINYYWQILANKFITYNVANFDCEEYSCTEKYLGGQNFENFDMNQTNCGIRDDINGTSTFCPCIKWSYGDAEFKNTITERFDLVCSKSSLTRFAQTLFFSGTLIGSVFCGQLADKYGRKTVYLLAMNLVGILGFAGVFVSTHSVYWMIISFLRGICVFTFQLSMSVYITEVVGGKWRSYVGHFWIGIPSQLGHMALGLFVYLVPNMIMLEIVLATLGLATIPLWYFMPESPRWLLVQGHKERAIKVIQTATRLNGNPQDISLLDTAEEFLKKDATENEEDSQDSWKELLKFPGTRRNFFLICVVWFCVSTGYYGLIYNTPAYGWNIFLVFVFPTFFTVPSYFICPYLENNLGRKFMLTVPLGISGILSMLTILIPRGHYHHNWPIIVLCTAGVVFCSISLNVAYTFTKELFPTNLRGTGLSFTSVFARIGAMVFPLIAKLDEYSEILPIAIFGLLPLLGSISSIFLWPETSGKNLPDSLEEAERRATTKNTWIKFCSKETAP